jgi:sugar lactone lactonase YvrE
VPTAEQITDPDAYHGEGPVWSPSRGALRWVDMLAGDVLSFDDSGAVVRKHVGSVAAAVRPRTAGGAVIAVERGFVLEEPDGSTRTLPEVWDDPQIRMNEGGCSPDGSFFCGSMHYEQLPGRAALYRLDPDLSVTPVFDDVTISNGLEWSPDGGLAYYVDTPTQRIDVFDYAAPNRLTNRRPFAQVPAEVGSPDGLTVDASGGVWVAIWHGSQVRRYAPDGRLDLVVDVPVTQVSACTFGGEHLDRLFITTSREGLDPGVEIEAGALWAYDAGVSGRPVRPFLG